MPNIKVSIVDDDDVFVWSLKRFLDKQSGIEIISTFNSKEAAIKHILPNPPDVILMDINLSGNNLDGIFLTKELLIEHKIKSKILIFTGLCTSKQIVLDSIKAGAVKYLRKTEIEVIPSEIRKLVEESPDSILAEAYRKEEKNSHLHSLTKHQLIHLKLIFNQKSRKQISEELNIEFTTVKKNLTRIYKLLKVKSRYELVEKYDFGYVDELLSQNEVDVK